jgi:sec-independent protein translocase protein TatC
MRKFFSILWRIITAPFRLLDRIFNRIARWINKLYNETHALLTEEPIDEPLPDTFAKTMENPMGLMEHIGALRKHLLRAIIFMAIATIFCFAFTAQIIDLLAKPVGGISGLQAIDVTESVGTFMRVALLCGFALALPYIAFEIWLFAAPGLSKRARAMGLFAIPAVVLFFLGGVAFAYFGLLPTALPFLLNFMGITTIPRPSTYIGFVTSLMFWIGVAFEFPLVIYLLASMNIIQARTLARQWRLAIVIIAVMAAAITPTIDPVNMSLVMGPLIILYIISIGLAYLAQRGQQSKENSST